jgi:hypothetical protein
MEQSGWFAPHQIVTSGGASLAGVDRGVANGLPGGMTRPADIAHQRPNDSLATLDAILVAIIQDPELKVSACDRRHLQTLQGLGCRSLFGATRWGSA